MFGGCTSEPQFDNLQQKEVNEVECETEKLLVLAGRSLDTLVVRHGIVPRRIL
jgi:hypothetical protein